MVRSLFGFEDLFFHTGRRGVRHRHFGRPGDGNAMAAAPPDPLDKVERIEQETQGKYLEGLSNPNQQIHD